ncbi:alginate lyase family protein [Virgibacillus dokdonensis]|uniref:Alginate lyase family protein n=1 Tax=Virgibacillus dokdonensis TaxID=302167 RepID=A0ABU7VJM5_9BACI
MIKPKYLFGLIAIILLFLGMFFVKGDYFSEKEESVMFENDNAFKVIEPASISLKKDGKLIKVGAISKGSTFNYLEDYGNWYKVRFGESIGYIWKEATEPIDNLTVKDNKISGNLLTVVKTPVYNSTTSTDPIAEINAAQHIQIVSKSEKGWYEIELLGRNLFVKTKNVIEENNFNVVKNNKNISVIKKSLIGSPLNRDLENTTENETINAANLILKDKVKFPKYNQGEPMDFSKGINWKEGQGVSQEHQRSYLRQLHGLFFISDLTSAFYTIQDENLKEKYINKGMEIIQDWENNNPYHAPQHKMAWHDESTARRLSQLIDFFETGKHHLNKQEKLQLFKTMVFHADLLTKEDFYSYNTNHGMFQDEALIIFSKYFYNFKAFSEYYKLAVNRLDNYFDSLISDDGVHLEHSPSYHQTIAASIKSYGNTLEEFGDHEIANSFEKKYHEMVSYATHVIKPDGNWPLIADTYASDQPISSFWPNNKYYQYAVSNGKRGEKPKSTNMVFPDAKYAIFRNSWNSDEKESTYLFFTAAYHTNYHKHSDDLSIWLYNGEDIITEAGPHSYTLSDPITEYAYSSFAHNTLIVDDKGLPRIDGKTDRTYIEDYNLKNEEKPVVKGVNKRFDGVTHERKVTYDKKREEISVNDDISSKKRHNFKLLWHIAPNIEPIINNNEIILAKNDEKIMKIELSSDVNLSLSKVFGDEDKIYKSWAFDNTKQDVKSNVYTLVLEFNGTKGNIKTKFNL